MADYAFLKGRHVAEFKRRGLGKATHRDELVPEMALRSINKKGKVLHSYMEGGKVHHMESNDDGEF
jgi:hypothetical protein